MHEMRLRHITHAGSVSFFYLEDYEHQLVSSFLDSLICKLLAEKLLCLASVATAKDM